MASEPPQDISLERHGERRRAAEQAARWLVVGLLVALAAAALLRVFGQSSVRSSAAAAGATLSVEAPTRLRGGLFYEGLFTVRAERSITAATLVLDDGWLDETSVNTIEPAPVGEASRNGRLALDFGHVPAGERLVVHMQFQVNPTNVGSRPQGVELHDGEALLARVDRTVRIFP